MSIYSDKLAFEQVIINCPYFVAQMCTREDTLAHNLDARYFNDVMSYNSFTKLVSVSKKSMVINLLPFFSLKKVPNG